jgi:hypothetical protein
MSRITSGMGMTGQDQRESVNLSQRFAAECFFLKLLKGVCLPMRIRRVVPLLVIALYLSSAAMAGVTGMTDEDREHLLVHFEMTGQVLAEQVRGLSQAQLEYRAAPDRWSIRECVSHLAVAEPDYWRELMTSVKAPPDMKGKQSSNTDADIL